MDPIHTIGHDSGGQAGSHWVFPSMIKKSDPCGGRKRSLTSFWSGKKKNTVSGMLAGSAGASLHVGAGGMGLQMPLNQRVFLAQFDAIQIAAEGPGVIVGRCADYVLKDRPGVTHIFIYASEERRIASCVWRWTASMPS